MAQIVTVHGIGQQQRGEQSLLASWRPALFDGIRRAKVPEPLDHNIEMAFYGDLFRPAGHTLGVGDPRYTAADVNEGMETELLLAWWQAAADCDPQIAPPGADTLARAPRSVQTALRVLSKSRFFSGIALRAMVFDLKQVSRYLTDQQLRAAACARVSALIDERTRVVVAHSLGSVVAYETLCALPGHGVRALVTLGSPLGIPMIHRRLERGPGCTPGGIPGGSLLTWTNVADDGDVVALVKDLRPLFGPQVRSVLVHNGSRAHDATAYLTDPNTGQAISDGLAGG
ncbi:hypothetical protein ACFVU0_34520 [Streptomyces sp. NPDC058122]|uniref:hypothetical protein n=1 Tax=Streptomyces sp. NPDC058122 TaxID=3346349 RepID=UPI0036ED30E5